MLATLVCDQKSKHKLKKAQKNQKVSILLQILNPGNSLKEKNLYTNFSPGIIFYNQTKVSIMEHQCNKQVQFTNPNHNLANKNNNHSDSTKELQLNLKETLLL